MSNWLLGWDVGTSGAKAVIFQPESGIVEDIGHEYSVVSPEAGWAEIPADVIWNTLLECTDSLLEKAGISAEEISSVGFCTLCPGVLAMDEKGSALLNPIIVTDLRSIEEAQFLKAEIGDEKWFKVGGNRIMPGASSATSMLWIKKHCPDTYKNAKYIGHLTTWLGHLLTGKFALDYSNASYTGMFSTGSDRAWHYDMIGRIGLDNEKLPPLKKGSQLLGGLINEQLIARGFKKGIPVAVGGGDTACSALALGVINNGDIFISMGTSGVVCVCSDQSKFDDRFMNRCHVDGKTWLFNGAMSSVGSSMQWFRDQFCQDIIEKARNGNRSSYQIMDEMAAESKPGSNGLVYLPYLAGERSPFWNSNAQGVFFGLSLQSDRKTMIRAVMEGCTYGIRQLIGIAEKMVGTFDNIPIIGGGAMSSIWPQIISDVTGKKITVLSNQNLAAIGASLLGGIAAGIFSDGEEAAASVKRNTVKMCQPNIENMEVYNEGFIKYEQLYPRLKDLFAISKSEIGV